MRFVLFFITAMPLFATAQNNFDLVFGTGLGTAYASSTQLQTTTAAIGVSGAVKAMWDTRKWQLGAGIDVGAMGKGTVKRELILINVLNNEVMSYNTANTEEAKFSSPYYSPHFIINYKLNIPDRLYFYGGGVLGYTFTRHGFELKPNEVGTTFRNVRGMTTGINLGLVIHLGDHVSLDLSESWRMSFLKDPDPGGYLALEKAERIIGPNYVKYYDESSLVTEYDLNVFHTSVAMRIRL